MESDDGCSCDQVALSAVDDKLQGVPICTGPANAFSACQPVPISRVQR